MNQESTQNKPSFIELERIHSNLSDISNTLNTLMKEVLILSNIYSNISSKGMDYIEKHLISAYLPKSHVDKLVSTKNGLKVVFLEEILSIKRDLCLEIEGFLVEVNKLNASEESIHYRIEWIRSFINTFIYTYKYDKSDIPKVKDNTFDNESFLLFQTIIDEAYLSKTEDILKEIEQLLLPFKKDNESIHETYLRFMNTFQIPFEKYEQIFEECINFTINKYKPFSNPINKLKIEYYNDISDSAEAYAQRIEQYSSVIRCNKARSISIIKVQQLTAHEATHHFQYTFLDDIISNHPEFELRNYSRNVYGYLLEGGAEVAVDLIFPYEERKNHLINKLLPLINRETNDEEVEVLMKLDSLTTRLWPGYIKTAKMYLNNEISEETSDKIMLEKYLKPKESWPNTLFYKNVRTYIGSYGWGKESIKKYIGLNSILDNNTAFEKFIMFSKKMKFPFK